MNSTSREEIAARMEQLVARLRRRRGVRHVVVGASSLAEGWTWKGADGVATPGGGPMTADTPFFLASVTKLHIAAVVLRLVEDGLVDLDGPIDRFLPIELRTGLHVRDGVDHTARLTVAHLLAHSSGLADWLDERPPGGRSAVEEVLEDGDRAWSYADAVIRARDLLTPHFAPSDPSSATTRIRYSDTNFQLLMVVAEHVTGESMNDLHHRLLLDPLGLSGTWLPGQGRPGPSPEPAVVWLGDEPFVDRPLAMASFGDLYSTLDDLLGFGRALFGGRLFDEPATAALMARRFHRFGLPRSAAAVRSPSWPIEYGLGLMRFRLGRLLAGGRRLPTLLGHTGSTGSWLWLAPELGLVLAGTVDQTTGAAVPFRDLPRVLHGMDPAGDTESSAWRDR
jgi:CubicO group peptidase (beta-lactamase class C family)